MNVCVWVTTATVVQQNKLSPVVASKTGWAQAEKFNAEIAVEIDVCSKCWKRDPSLCLFREDFLMLRLKVPSS